MDDRANTSQNTEYAGPPKSHAFQSNTGAPQIPPGSVAKNESAPTPSAPKNTGMDDDLLGIISASDKVVAQPKKNKKQISFDVKDLTAYKKKIHEYFKSKESLFHKLDIFWMILKFFFYVIGLGFFACCFVLYIRFEDIVNVYLKEHKLENVTIGRTQYSLNGVIFSDVREKNGLFTIDKMKASFSFASLLDKQIQQVELNGLQVFPEKTKNLSDSFEALVKSLSNLGLVDGQSWFSVQNLRIEDSTMQIRNKDYQGTVKFSGAGSLVNNKQITLPLTFEHKNLSIIANLLVKFGAADTTWTLDILSGHVILPVVDKQNLTGQVTVKTRQGSVQSCSFSGSLTNLGLEKQIELILTQKSHNLYDLTSAINIKTPSPIKIETTVQGIAFDKNLTSFASDGALTAKVTNFNAGQFSIESMELSVPSVVMCDANGCVFKMAKGDTTINIFMPEYKLKETNLSVLFPINLILVKKPDPYIVLNKNGMSFDLTFGRINVDVKKRRLVGDSHSTMYIDFDESTIQASYDATEKKWNGTLETGAMRFDDELFTTGAIRLTSQFTDDTINNRLTAKRMQMKEMPYFKVPVNIEAIFDQNYNFDADIYTADKWMTLKTTGYYSPYTGEVVMSINNKKPLIFSKDTLQPAQITSLVDSSITDFTGKVDFKGQIHYNNLRSVTGPVKLLLDDVSFKMGNVSVTGLNSVLDITHIVPFGTQGTQEVYIRSLNAVLPFQDVYAHAIIDAGKKQFNISSLETTVAGYPLRLDPMWYGYNSPSYTFSLKGKSTSLQNVIENTNIDNLNIIGTGVFSVTAQLQQDEFFLRRLELSIPSDGSLQYDSKDHDNLYLKNLASLEFRRLSANIIQQSNSFELQFSADNKVSKVKKKTNFHQTIKGPLSKYIKATPAQSVPNTILRAKQEFYE